MLTFDCNFTCTNLIYYETITLYKIWTKSRHLNIVTDGSSVTLVLYQCLGTVRYFIHNHYLPVNSQKVWGGLGGNENY